MSVEAFLELPEEKPYRELWDGEVVEKAMPTDFHGALVLEFGTRLKAYLSANPIAWVSTEVRHHERETGWVFLPDLYVTLRSRRPEGPREVPDPVTVMPDLVIEILSPADRPGRVTEKVARYQQAGVTVVWLVEPEDRSITVIERGALPHRLGPGETLRGEPVLPGLAIPVDDVFGKAAMS